MSIINDALKKAQKDRAAITRDNAPAARNLEVQFDKRKQGMNWGPVFVLLVLVLITGPILAPVLASPFKRTGPGLVAATDEPRQVAAGETLNLERGIQIAQAPAPEDAATTRRGQFGIEEAPRMAAPLYARPNLALTGVVVSAADSYCILNDRVVKVGESVQGARLTRVTADEVELDFQGERIVLPVSQA